MNRLFTLGAEFIALVQPATDLSVEIWRILSAAMYFKTTGLN
jgi:hypothetical protein